MKPWIKPLHQCDFRDLDRLIGSGQPLPVLVCAVPSHGRRLYKAELAALEEFRVDLDPDQHVLMPDGDRLHARLYAKCGDKRVPTLHKLCHVDL